MTAPIQEERTLIRPVPRWVAINLGELWRYRELLVFFAWRDIKVRYRQTVLGALWAVIPPLVTAIVFNVMFGLLLAKDKMPTVAGVPYVLSTFCALVAWQFCARALQGASTSIADHTNVITKVYFPRVILPVSRITSSMVELGISFVVLVIMMFVYGSQPGWNALAAPLFLALEVVMLIAVGLWLSALHALFRDIGHMVPFLLQIWMLVSPVIYTAEQVFSTQSGWVVTLYSLNPMVVVIEGLRWSLLGGPTPFRMAYLPSLIVLVLMLISGLFVFRRLEATVADVV